MNLINRDISWLGYNERVLQEATDDTVPLVERMRFLGIYSNNMDEFFRVRVANLRRLTTLKKQKIDGFNGSPEELYKEIREIVLKQQEKFKAAYEQIVAEFSQRGVRVINEKQLSEAQLLFLKKYFLTELKHEIFPLILDKKNEFPKLRDYAIYLAIKLEDNKGKIRYALIQIPSEPGRFVILPNETTKDVILLDDIIRIHLKDIFSIFQPVKADAFTFKFTRDAELDLDDDLTTTFIEKIEKSLKQRKKGIPVRFVYDSKMPKDLLDFLLKSLELKFGLNTIPGGRYHNFKDFMRFPDFKNPDFLFKYQPPNDHPKLKNAQSIINVIEKEDILLHFPYQRFDHVVDLLREAAIDPKVRSIKINIYRVARNSDVMKALLAAVFNGKEVTVVMELQARFDEENNLYWSDRLKEFGARVIYGVPGLKVHSKLLQITRISGKKEQFISYIGTGNFNERTSTIYTDVALLTANREIALEVNRVFRLIENNLERGTYKHLLVSPFNSRRKLFSLIEREITHVKKGKTGAFRMKLNNLTDKKIIEKLYDASKQGVKIQLIIRGICCLKPGVKGLSENIEVISIVDRYLEHARFFIFENAGNPEYIITSADLMERNLDNRVEVGVFVQSKEIQDELNRIFDFQWRGSVKARLISSDSKTRYRKRNLPPFHAQQELYGYYESLLR
jgi:polyphosphate kinase